MATQGKSNVPDQRWQEILEIVCENVSSDWQNVSQTLGLSRTEISEISSMKDTPYDCCWEALSRWKSRCKSPGLAPHSLTVALTKCRQRRMADIISKLCVSQESVEDILSPHLSREVRMREAMYHLTDSASSHWRHLAKKFGLTPADIAEIESSDHGRLREKCMNVLYRWRQMVPLSDFKVGNLIQALNACGLTDTAVKLRPFAGSSDVPKPTRKKRKGEAIIHIDTELVRFDVDRPSSTSSISPCPRLQPLPKDLLREYALNKLLVRFQDDLDLQDSAGTHDLVKYFHGFNSAAITEVSRAGRYIVVQCDSRDEVHELYRLARNGDISEKVTECLVKEEILGDLGITQLRLKADIYDSELLTVRTEESSRSHSQALSTPRE